MMIRALVADPTNASTMRFATASEPEPGPGQLVIDTHHLSLNHGDLNDARSGRIPPGGVLGSDVAGVVVRAAADRSGPPEGTRVVAMAENAFAERVAAGTGSVTVVPDGVDLAVAATLPVAGRAALGALRAAGPLLWRRVLVTGASGGVGRFAVQLAAAAGARVIASVGGAERGAGLREGDGWAAKDAGLAPEHGQRGRRPDHPAGSGHHGRAAGRGGLARVVGEDR